MDRSGQNLLTLRRVVKESGRVRLQDFALQRRLRGRLSVDEHNDQRDLVRLRRVVRAVDHRLRSRFGPPGTVVGAPEIFTIVSIE